MGLNLSIAAYSGANSKDFQKHLKAVKFCLENELSFPSETELFFRGHIGGDDLDDVVRDSILKYIENGITVPIEITAISDYEFHINIADIPSHIDKLIVKLV